MRDERHRQWALDAFNAYCEGSLDVRTYPLKDVKQDEFLPQHQVERSVYVLRLGGNAEKSPSIRAIPNQLDRRQILYIGGHESGASTGRYNVLIDQCRRAEQFFVEHGYAHSDTSHSHTVAQCLTTSLLQAGFTIANCTIDLVSGGSRYDELDFIIGYQETYHCLPPWNAVRKGITAYVA